MITDVRQHNGRPRFFIDGSPVGMTFMSPHTNHVHDAVTAGIPVWDTHSFTPLGWVGDGVFDYHNTDCYIEHYLRQSPDSLLILRAWPGYCHNREGSHANPKAIAGWDASLREDWWGDLHPDECERGENGETLDWPVYKPHSMASGLYRGQVSDAIERWVRHIEQSFGGRVFAYVIGGGPCGEWFDWSCYYADARHVGDYSPAMRAYFRAWLKGRYGSDDALRAAWGSADARLDTAAVPSYAERCGTGARSVRLPGAGRNVIDYAECFSDALADTLLEWTAAAKRGAARAKAVGVFYGYTLTVNGAFSVRRAQNRMDRVLGSDDIDFVIAPYHYDNRMLGGAHGTQVPAATVTAHGKVYLDEVDTSTHLAGPYRKASGAVLARTADESIALLKRDWAYNVINGHALWFMDLGGGWYADPAILSFVRQCHDLECRMAGRAMQPRTETAVIVDDRMFTLMAENTAFLNPLLVHQVFLELAYAGAPFNIHLLSDIHSQAMPDYRFFVVLSPFVLDARDVDTLHARFARTNATVVWTVCPGLVRDGIANTGNIAQAVGMAVHARDRLEPLLVRLTDHPLVPGELRGKEYGYDPDNDPHAGLLADNVVPANAPRERHFFTPRIIVTDTHAECLGMTRGAETGLAAKEQRGWLSVFSTAPAVPAEMLRALARRAGVHIYTATRDIVFANDSLVAVHRASPGPCTIDLPEPRTVADLFTGTVLGGPARSITIPSGLHQTHVLELR
ncbi:hypothetical protein GX586_08435 [bacterium]|nr:hypothetical protein [bacterium]